MATGINVEACHLDVDSTLQVSFWCFDVADGIWKFLSDLEGGGGKQKNLYSLWNVVKAYLYVSSYTYVARVSRDVCGAAEAPEGQAGKQMASKSSLAKL